MRDRILIKELNVLLQQDRWKSEFEEFTHNHTAFFSGESTTFADCHYEVALMLTALASCIASPTKRSPDNIFLRYSYTLFHTSVHYTCRVCLPGWTRVVPCGADRTLWSLYN